MILSRKDETLLKSSMTYRNTNTRCPRNITPPKNAKNVYEPKTNVRKFAKCIP